MKGIFKTTMENNPILALLISYLLGSVPFSLIVGKLAKGIDLRKAGTRNVGGTNLIMNAGVGWGILGGALDILKGTAAMWMTQELFKVPFPQSLLAGLAVVAGHDWSIWLGFKGGKGLATMCGVLAWIVWPWALVAAAIYALVHWPTRNGTTACLAAFAATFIYFYFAKIPFPITLLVIGIIALVFLASAHDMLNTAKTANTGGSWVDNFITPKSAVNKKPSAPRKAR